MCKLKMFETRAVVVLAAFWIVLGSIGMSFAGEVSGLATDLKVSVPLEEVLVEAFEVNEAGVVDGIAFASTKTAKNGSFKLPLGPLDHRIILKFSKDGRTDVFLPNRSVGQASGALVIGAGQSLAGIFVIVPKKLSEECCYTTSYSIPTCEHRVLGRLRCRR